MANKVMSLHDAVEKYVHDNDVLCLGGFTTNRKPYAAVYEILRQGKTGFVGWSGPAGGDWDSLIGEGRVELTSTATQQTLVIQTLHVVSVLQSRKVSLHMRTTPRTFLCYSFTQLPLVFHTSR